MEDTRQVRGRARGRARPLVEPVLRPGNVQRSAGATCVSPEYSLQNEIDRTTTAVARLSLRDQIRNQVAVVKQLVPDGLKRDTSGFYLNLEANCLKPKLLHLYQYRVDFDPEVDRTQVRKKILAQVYKDKLSGYIFNGSVVITSTHIPPGLLTMLTNPEGDSGTFKITLRRVDTEQCDFHLSGIVRKCLELLKLQILGRNSCALAAGKIPNYRIQLWPGYFTSIRQQQSQIQMCCEIPQMCIKKDNLLLIIHQCMRQDEVNYKRNFENLIVGCVVITYYNNRTYRIDDIDWDKTITSTYSTRNGCSLSYKDYYMQRYKINVVFNFQPLLVSRAKARELRIGMGEKLYLVPELCRITGLTEKERSNTQLVAPDECTSRLKLYYARMEKYTIEHGSFCTRASAVNAQLVIETVHRWVVMCPLELKRVVMKYVQNLQQTACTMAMNLPLPTVQAIDDDRPVTYIDGLEYVIDKFNPELVVCIINNNKSNRYNAIMKKCCVDRGVRSQIILRSNVNNRGIMAVATQVYCKLGGIPWIVNIPAATLMVVGLHVSRDAIDSTKCYSAMVSSLDEKMSTYFSIVSTHANKEELSNNCSLNITNAVIKYQKDNKERLPDHIIIYRDGVRDLQWNEVRGIRRALNILYHKKGKAAKLAFIVVTKRINTITQLEHEPNRYHFQVVSQITRHGTVSPANCNVIYDTLGFSPAHVQEITYKLTHLYYNFTGETRVPAPCQYAHKLAHLVAHSLHRHPNPRLNRTVFYL